MNTRSRKHAWGQTLTSGIVLGIPVLLLAAFGLSAYVTFKPIQTAQADKAEPAKQMLAAVDPAPVAKAVAAPRAKTACCAKSAAKAQSVAAAKAAKWVAVTRLVSETEVGVRPALVLAVAKEIPTVDAMFACEDADAQSASSKSKSKSHSYSYGYNDDDQRDFFWALVQPSDDGDGINTIGSTDVRASKMIKKAAAQDEGRFLYVRVDGRDRVIRDAALIERADQIVEPMQELGKKMGELGGRQGRLGGQQGQLGGQQGRLGARQGALASRSAILGSRMASRSRRGLDTSDLEAEQRKIEAEQQAIGEEMDELGRQMTELGAKQEVLGKEQERYGKQMQTISQKAETQIRDLAQEAIQKGKAPAISGVDA